MTRHLCSICMETWREPKPVAVDEQRGLLRPCPRCVDERKLPVAA